MCSWGKQEIVHIIVYPGQSTFYIFFYFIIKLCVFQVVWSVQLMDSILFYYLIKPCSWIVC